MRRILVLGYFGYVTNQLDGQTVKTRDVCRLVAERCPSRRVSHFDTQRLHASRLTALTMLWQVCRCGTLVYLPANDNLKYIFPLLFVLSRLLRFRIHYFVVGGWLSDFIRDMPLHVAMLRRIEGIHVETRRLREALRANYAFPNVDIFPNFRFFDFTPPQRTDSSATLRLVFMARIMQEKGIDWLMALARHIAAQGEDITLTFYGQIDPKDRDAFLAAVRRHPFVTYRGALAPEDIYRTLSHYDALLLPTHFYTEGLPGSIVDAYIAGLPVVVTRWQNAEEFVEEGRTGFIIPFEDGQQALIERVMYLHTHRDRLAQMQAHALEKRKEFSPPMYLIH